MGVKMKHERNLMHMSKKLGVFLLALTLLLSIVPSASIYAQSNEDTLENPFIWADVPDLDVIRVGDAYYMSSTTMHMNPGVPIMKSYDLKNWEIVNYVYDILADNDEQALRNGKDNYGKGSWASSLRYHNGNYFVAFASYDTGKTYIYQTTDIEKGPWTHSELDGVYHDMSLLFDDDGRVYMVYGSGDIKAIELTADATAIKAGGLNKVIIPNASLVASTAENVSLAAEGTHIQKINGKYYVFNITWPKNSSRIEIMHRADSIDGVYEGRVALNNAGIAQGGMIDTVDGKWYAMLFGDRGSVGRIPYLVPVTWNDGWPVFGVNGTVPQSMAIPVSGTASKNNLVASDEFYQSSQKIGASHNVMNTSTNSTTSSTTTTPVTPLPINEGTELFVNGGMENGLTPWEKHDTAMVAVSTDEHFSGTNSLYISGRGATGAGVQQFVTGKIKAGAIYKFTAKVKYNSGPATKQFNLDFQDGDWTTIKILGSGVMTKGEWGTIEGTYTVPADATFTLPRIFIETIWTAAQDPTNDLMNFYVDDISFVDVTPDGNLLANGKIEKGLTPWGKHDTATVVVTTAEHFSGSNSLFVSGRTATGAGVQQSVTGKVTAGSKYKFSAKVKYNSGPATRTFNFDIQDGDWQTIKVLGSGIMTKGAWGTIEGTYTVPDNAVFNQPRIFIETSWTAAQDLTNDLMDFYVDDISLIDATPAGGLDKAKNGEYDYNGSNLGLVWQWNHNPDNNHWSLTERPGYLRLTTGRKSTSILDARNTLTQRTFGPESSGNAALDISKMKDGDYAGLAAFQKEYGFVGVKMSGTSKSIVMMDGSSGTPVEQANIPVTQNNVYFKIDFDFKNQTDKAYFYYSLNGITWTAIGNTLQMHYTLPHFMGYRFALFNYATKTTGGIVDFDYFRIEDKLTGTNASATILQANLANVPNVIGVQNIELQVPVKMNALPTGNYSGVSASFNIPKELAVTGVDFNTANIVGNTSYTYTNNQLQLNVTGNTVNFTNNQSSDVFATIKLKVNGFVPADQTVQISTDYIKVDGGNVLYNVTNTVSNIGLKLLPTNAYAKIPGYANPLMSHKLGADPFAMVYDGRVYIYMSSDDYEYDANGNIKDNSFSNLNRIFVISSDDMVNWTDHGAIPVAGKNNANNGAGIAKWADLSWAPAAGHKKINGVDKFFLYFANGASGIGVLTADSPIGPWTDPLGQALITGNSPGVPGVAWLFDPAVLVDDDGTGYLYFGGGIPGDPNPTPEQIAHPKTARVVKLTDDMIHIVGSAVTIDAPFMFEDSGIHKYEGKYYYSYCSNFSGTHPDGTPPPGEIAYMVSDSQMGPFTYVSPILKNPSVFFGVGGNNHHAIFEFNDQWYVVYHAQTVSKAVVGDGKGYRSPHINKVEYYENGLIKDIKGDMKGVSQIANLDPYTRVEAETIAWNAGILTEVSTAPGNPLASLNLDVTDVNNGDWLAVSNADFGDKGTASFEANVASTIGGKVEIRLDSPIGEVIGTLDVAPTGGNQVWQLMKTNVENVKGVHHIFFMFSGSGSNLFNMDYWKFNEKAPGPVVIPLESVSITGGAQSVTVNDQLTFNSMINPSSVTGATYLWEVSGGISIIGANNNDSVTVKGTNAGTGTLKLTVLAGGTEKTAVTAITVTPASVDPGPDVNHLQAVTITNGAQSVTVNDQITFNSVINPSSVTGATYLWEASGSINIVGESNKDTITIKGVSVGTGTLKLTVNAGGTQKTAETTITVTPSSIDSGPDLQSITITNGSPLVTVNNQLTFNSVINPSSVTGATYLWEASGSISIVSNSNKDMVTIKGVSVGTGTLKLTVNAGGTEKIAATTITVVSSSSSSDPDFDGGNNSSGNDTGPTTPSNNAKDADILVNGKAESAGSTATTQVNGQMVTTISFDQKKLDQLLTAVGEKANITVPVTGNSDIVIGQLDGQIIKNLQENKAVLEIKTDRATYTLPAQQIDLRTISNQVGESVALQDISIQIEIARPTTDMARVVANAAEKDKFTLVVPPIDFTVRAIYGDKIIDLAKFNAYVKRKIAIPDGVDPNKITTSVVVESNGTVRHVPTKIVIIDGKYYAEVSSLTNSTYSLIWHPISFSDVSTHWAKDEVNDLGSRMVISGIGNDLFNPDADITRAEFAAIIVRGLGLKLENSSSNFSDVKAMDWYNSAIMTAQSNHLIDGFEDGTFRPGDKITREQAMVIIAKAMAMNGLKAKLTNHNAADVLRTYTDATDSAPWAISGIADSIQAGIVSGRDESTLAPKAYITRAEVARLVQQLLRKSDLL